MNPLEEIKRITEHVTGFKDVSVKSSKTEIIKARCIYFVVSKTELGFSDETVSNFVNHKRHASLNASRVFEKYCYQSSVFKKNYETVKRSFNKIQESNIFISDNVDKVYSDYEKLKVDYDTVVKKQRKDRRKLMKLLKTEKTSNRLLNIINDLNPQQIEQMFERMESFAQICNYHNQKKKLL